jgi:hypothetical protein
MKNVKKLEETIQRVAINTISYTRKVANKEWFDKKCANVNTAKNAAREQAIQIKTRDAKNAHKLAGTKERRLYRKNGRHEQALIEIEQHRSIQESRKSYKRLHDDVRRPFECVSNQERGTINQQKTSAGEMERTF